jgi:hypothetical protein
MERMLSPSSALKVVNRTASGSSCRSDGGVGGFLEVEAIGAVGGSATEAGAGAGAAGAGAGLVADNPPVSLGVLESARDLAKSSWPFIMAEDDDDGGGNGSCGPCRPFGAAIVDLGALDTLSSDALCGSAL